MTHKVETCLYIVLVCVFKCAEDVNQNAASPHEAHVKQSVLACFEEQVSMWNVGYGGAA